MAKLLDKAVQLVRKPLDADEIIYKNGDTAKIIEVVRKADSIAASERLVKDFAPLLRGRNDYETCRNVWRFFRYEIPYVPDKAGYERVRLPNKCIWDAKRYNNGGDCKTFAVGECDILRELGIRSQFWFINQNFGTKAKHVYTVAILRDGRQVACDGVYQYFDMHPFNTRKWVFDAQLLRGANTQTEEKTAIGGLHWF